MFWDNCADHYDILTVFYCAQENWVLTLLFIISCWCCNNILYVVLLFITNFYLLMLNRVTKTYAVTALNI